MPFRSILFSLCVDEANLMAIVQPGEERSKRAGRLDCLCIGRRPQDGEVRVLVPDEIKHLDNVLDAALVERLLDVGRHRVQRNADGERRELGGLLQEI